VEDALGGTAVKVQDLHWHELEESIFKLAPQQADALGEMADVMYQMGLLNYDVFRMAGEAYAEQSGKLGPPRKPMISPPQSRPA